MRPSDDTEQRRGAARTAAAILILVALAGGARAADFQILIDLDDSAATGCAVATPDGVFEGAEQVITTAVDTGVSPPLVTGVTRRICSGGILVDDLGFVPQPPLSWPTGPGVGTAGTNALETYAPLPSTPQAPLLRVGFVSHQGLGATEDAMITDRGSSGGSDILIPWGGAAAAAIPTLGEWGILVLLAALATTGTALLRRRRGAYGTLVAFTLLVGSAAVLWAASIVRDGAVDDWAGVPQVASDPDDDAGGGVDMVAAFAQIQNGRLDVRLDFAGNRPPTAEAQTVSTVEDTSAPITLSGSDPEGDPLTFAIAAVPANGSLSGTPPDVTYMPDADFNGADSFTFEVDDGNGGTDSATVSITVVPVNDQPVVDPASFSVPENAAVGSVLGAVTYSDPDAGQSHTFALTAGNTGDAFAVDPATGDITVAAALDFEALSSYSLTVEVTDDGSPALSGSITIGITVTNVDDPPTAVADGGTVTEDDPATTIDVLANDTDQDGGTMSIQSVTQPTNGTAAVTGGGAGVTYAPAANYCNDGSPLDTFTYTLNGGSTATVSVTVTCVDDLPLAVADAATVTEDSGANPIDVLLNDSDIDAGPRMVALVENPSTQGGTVLITGGGSGVSYAPASDACNTPPGTSLDTFTYTLNGGSSAIVTVSVTCVNDPPLIDLDGDDDNGTGGSDFAVTFTEGDAATLLVDPTADATGAVISDIDSTTLVSLTVTLTNLLDAGDEVLDADASMFPAIIKAYDTTTPGTGVLTLTSLTPQAIADYVTVLQTVTYVDSNPSPDATPRVVRFVANDGTSDSNTATSTVTLNVVDNPPVAVADAATVDEDSGATMVDVLANDTDVDGGTKEIRSVTQPANGAVVITNAGADLTYAPDADYCNDGSPLDTFTYTLNGGSTATVGVTVTCVDDPPVAVADAATVNEDSGAGAIDVLANDTDVDGSAKTVESVTQPANGTVVITGGGVGLTYAPDANYCNDGSPLDTFGYTLNGGSTATVSVTVTCVDDPPVAVADAATIVEDSGAGAIDVLANDTDVDGGTKAVQSVTQPANGTVVIIGGGTGLTYAPSLNYCNNPPGVIPATFTYTLNGGSSTTVSVTVTCVNDPPVAGADAFDFIGNTELEVDQDTASTPEVVATTPSGLGVLDNDSDPVESDSISIVGIVGCGDLTPPFGCPIAGVGTVTLEADGSFSFVPLPGDPDATESFQYLLSDGTSTATGTVTLTRFERVWYVDNSAGGGGDGTSTAPFATITQTNLSDNDSDGDLTDDLDGPNDYIFVSFGDGTSTGQSSGLSLENGQHLIGEHVGLVLDVGLNGDGAPTTLVAASPGSRPLLDDTIADGFDGVSARNVVPAEIAGMNLAGNVNGVDWTTTAAFAGSGTFEIRDCVVRAAGAEALDINLAGSTAVGLAFHDNVLTANGTALDIQETGTGSLTVTAFAGNAVSGDTGGSGIAVTNAVFDAVPGGAFDQVAGGTTVVGAAGNGVGAAGVVLTNVTGDLAFTDLDVYADGGVGLQVSGTGAVNVGAGTGTRLTVGAGVATITAAGGPAVSLSSMTAGLALSRLASTNSPTTGVSLQNVVDGTSTAVFSAGSGSTITNAAGTAFNVDGGNATVSYAGTITNAAGRSVAVANRTADSVTFTGAITDTGSGISLTSNTGSTIAFTGALSLTTGSNPAFAASGGGTVSATDTASTITTTTGTALNVANTTIGASGLRFASVSAGTAASGPANGIVLNNTGALGGLTVNGGTIRSTGSHGVSLTATLNPTFNAVTIRNTNGSGVRGTGVTGFTFTNGTIDATGPGADESNIAFNTAASGTETNVSGTLTVTGNLLTNSAWHGIDIQNFNGTLSSVTISNNTITSSTSAAESRGSGVRMQALGSATSAANVTRATIANNIITNFPSGAGIVAQGGNTNAAGPAGTFGTAGSGTDLIAITGNRIAGQSAANRMGTSSIIATVSGRGQGNFEILSNGTVASPLTNMTGTAILCGGNGNTRSTFFVDNNVIVANNAFGSNGIGGGTGSAFGTSDTPDMTWTISNNSIAATEGNGILAVARGATGSLKVKIQGNTVAAPVGGLRQGIRVDAGNAGSVDDSVCLNISGNTSSGSTLAPNTASGIGLRKQGTTPATNDFSIHGMAAMATPGVESYVGGLNPASSTGTFGISGTDLISATSGFSGCFLP